MDVRKAPGRRPPVGDLDNATLRESEERLRLIQQAGRIGSFEWDIASGRVYRSPEYSELQGLPPGTAPEDRYDRAWLERVHPADRPSVETWFEELMRAGGEFDREYRIIRSDTGETRWLNSRGRVDLDPKDRPVRLLLAQTDVTEQKRALDALRVSEQRFSRFMQHLPGLAWIKDVAGRYVYANEAAQQAFQRETGDLYGRTDFEIFPAETASQFAENDARAIASGAGLQTIETLTHEDGEIHYSLVNKFPIPGVNDEPAYVGGMAIDITEQRTAEAALRASEARYRAVVESQTELVCRFRTNGEIIFVNGAYARACGSTPEAMVGKLIWPDIPEEDRALIQDAFAGLSPEEPEARVENRFQTIDGERWILWTNRGLFFDASGRCIEAQATGVDITDRKEAEEHRKLLIDELNHRVKNTLMTVQAIANLSVGGDQSAEETRKRFTSRIHALSRVHNLLSEENWQGASLLTVLGEALEPYGYFGDKGRIRLAGPTLLLPPRSAQAVAIAFHELATNAAKYGALSNENGVIDVVWSRDGESCFELSWSEIGGPEVKPPQRTGFGAMMITELLAAEIGGDVTLDYARSGLVCRMRGTV